MIFYCSYSKKKQAWWDGISDVQKCK